MKNTAKLTLLLAATLCLAACDKDNESVAMRERDITYTVAGGTQTTNQRDGEAQSTTVHLTTAAEWEALLERFCNWAEEGSTVTFYGTQAPLPAKGGQSQAGSLRTTKDATTFSTTDREEMKRWMAQMEDEGKTVTVSYDSESHTWHGTAYATAQQPQQDNCYTGVLVSVGNPAVGFIVPPGIVAALRISDDSTLIIAMDGQWFWNGLVLDGVTYSDGDTLTICGTVQTMHDYYGNVFFVLELNEAISPDQPPLPSSGLITYEYDGMYDLGFGYIWSFDTVNHLVYITLHYTLQNITTPDYPVGVYEYRHADEVNTISAYWLIDSWGDTAGLYNLESIGSDTLHFNSTHIGNPVTLVRTDRWHTYLCSNLGLKIAMHVCDNIIDLYPEVYIGQMDVNGMERIDFVWPFEFGRFEMWRTEMTQSAMGIPYWGLTLDYRPFGGTDTIGNLTMQGEPLTSSQITISTEGGIQFVFDRR